MEALEPFLVQYGLLIVPLMLLAGGVGAPFPEDLIVIGSSYMVYCGTFAFVPTLVVLIVSILLSDSLLYALGYGMQAKFVPEATLARLRPKFARYGIAVVFGARFAFGTRGVVFASAGALRLPYKSFFLADAAAGAIFLPTLMSVTVHYGEHVDAILARIQKLSSYGGVVVLILIGAAAMVSGTLILRRRRRAALVPGTGDDNSGAA